MVFPATDTSTTLTVLTANQIATSFSGLMASQSIAYGTPGVALNGNISTPGAAYPASGEPIAVIINGVTQTTSINDSTGDFSLSYTNTGGLPTSAVAYTITYAYAGDNVLPPASDSSTALTVIQGTPILTWTNPASIIYGALLTTNELDATAREPGSFVYCPTNGTALDTGTNTLSVVFTPTDTVDYTGTTNTVSVVVEPAVLTVIV
ncbi:MAG: hypothetical protein ABSF34_06550 [Verrucomicrobiota bacterium]